MASNTRSQCLQTFNLGQMYTGSENGCNNCTSTPVTHRALEKNVIQKRFAQKITCRSRRPEVSCQKRCSQKFCKIHRKTPVPENLLLKKSLWHRCFPVNFAKCLRPPFLTEHLWWLLLQITKVFSICKIIRVFIWEREGF